MTSEELIKKVYTLVAELDGVCRIVEHDMYCIEIDAVHILLFERMETFSRVEKLARVSYIVALFDPSQELARSDRVETWGEIEAWIHGFVDRIRSKR